MKYFYTVLVCLFINAVSTKLFARYATPLKNPTIITLENITKSFHCNAIILFRCFNNCTNETNAQMSSLPDTSIQQLQKDSQLVATYNIIPAAGNTYGYGIFINGRKVIEQLTIPTKQGNRGFANRNDAAIVAALVVQKIKQGQMPPTVSEEELAKLHIK